MEVILDVLIPYVTASLIDKGINAGSMENVYLDSVISYTKDGITHSFMDEY